MDETVLQYRLEKACKKTTGKFFIDEKHELVVCDFGSHKIELEKNDLAMVSSPFAWARFYARDTGNIFVEGIPKSGQGIWVKANKMHVNIGPTGWNIVGVDW